MPKKSQSRATVLLRRLKISLLLLLSVFAIGTLFGFAWLRTSLPQTSGRLHVAGVRQPIEIWRDRYAVVHIFAASERDAYFGLGFAHAQDRLWQMEMQRRIAAGRTAEVLGATGLPTDRLLRTLGVRRNAERILESLDEGTRLLVQAYCDGVNAWINYQRGTLAPLPPEFLITKVRPEPWTPADAISWYTIMAWDLSGNWQNELARMRLTARLDPNEIAQLIPPAPGDRYPKLTNYAAIYRGLAGTAQRLAELAPALPAEIGLGSNNWVVDGNRTESGKPLLANDPHLNLVAPSLWYLAHLHAPDFNVIGASVPGMPAIVLGHNERIAWGATNTGSDSQDLYIEMLDERGRALTPKNGWKRLESREERIRVKGGGETRLIARESRHGPLISDVVTSLGDALPEGYAIALQWAALRADDRTVRAGFAIPRARNWHEFVAALEDFHSPQLTMVYADIDGNIGMIAPGRVPIRRSDNDLGGLAPATGWVARYDWAGFVPFEAIPRWHNPKNGKLLSANNRIVPDTYRYPLTYEWTLPFRASRIAQLLDATAHHDVGSFAMMQGDIYSGAIQGFVPHVLQVPPADAREREILTAIANWDGRMDGTRPEPLVMAAWLRELGPLIYADELGPTLFKSFWRDRFTFLRNVLDHRDDQHHWCNDVSTQPLETCAEQSAKAFHRAVAYLTLSYGADWRRWRWDAAHFVYAEHRPFTAAPRLARWFNVQRPFPGDANTVNAASYRIGDEAAPFAVRHGPSYRAIYDTADWEASLFIQSTGQSGNLLSSHYADFADAWARNRYLPMRTRRETLEAESDKLTLLP